MNKQRAVAILDSLTNEYSNANARAALIALYETLVPATEPAAPSSELVESLPATEPAAPSSENKTE